MNSDSRGARGLLLLAIGALLAILFAPGALAATDEADPVGAAGDSGSGYLVLTSTGEVLGAGGAVAQGGIEGNLSAEPVTVVTVDGGRGYFVVESNGKVTGFGSRSSGELGDLFGFDLDQPIVDMVMTPSGRGYYLLGRDGGVFAFGDAEFLGSVPQHVAFEDLVAPVVAMLMDAAGTGYWIFAADGGVFAFGTAGFHGALPSLVAYQDLDAPVVGATRSSDGAGYGLVGRDGGVFAFGSFDFLGSLSATPSGSFVDLESDGSRYVLLEEGGDILGPDGSSVRSGTAGAVALAVIPDTSVFNTTTTTRATTTTTRPTTTTTTGGGGGGNVVFNDNGLVHDAGTYAQASSISLHNVNGRANLHLKVVSKASNKRVRGQVCFWNHDNGRFKLETCSPAFEFSTTGTYDFNLGRPTSWWSITGPGTFPWNKTPDVGRIMIKDPNTGELLMTSRCGAHCSSSSAVNGHVPIVMDARLTFSP